jgi:hypothetical protein
MPNGLSIVENGHVAFGFTQAGMYRLYDRLHRRGTQIQHHPFHQAQYS